MSIQKAKTTYVKLPIFKTYTDKLDIVGQVLKMYRVLSSLKLTDRDIDILKIMFICEMNSDIFKEMVIECVPNVNTIAYIRVLMSRLRKKGVLVKDKNHKDRLEDGLYRLKEMLDNESNIILSIAYEKKI